MIDLLVHHRHVDLVGDTPETKCAMHGRPWSRVIDGRWWSCMVLDCIITIPPSSLVLIRSTPSFNLHKNNTHSLI